MLPAGFETAFPANERPQTYELDCAGTGIGYTTRIPVTIKWALKEEVIMH